MSKFSRIQDDIYDLAEAANAALPPELALYYGGTYLTGRMQNPEYLFIGANPGHGHWDTRQTQFERKPYREQLCKFIEEYDKNELLARRVVDVILQGEVQHLHNCAETSAYSFFGTPGLPVLDAQLKKLKDVGLFDRHATMMRTTLQEIIQDLQPKKVICIGVEVFDEVKLVCGATDKPVRTEKSEKRRVFLETDLDGTPLLGILHLSGAQPSRDELGLIAAHFQ